MLNISDISDNLEFKDGIWSSKTKSDVSYPDKGNDLCFQIEDNCFWFKHRNDCIIEVIKNFPPEGEIFDIGGGNGFVTTRLERDGFKTVLVDPGLHGVRNAEKRGLSNIICSTLKDAGFKKESISAVGLFDVLEHIKNDLDFLGEIRRILVAYGKLFLTVPAYGFLWSEEDILSGHFRRYSRSTLPGLLKSAGFKIEYCSHIFLGIPLPIFLFRVLPYKMRLHKKKRTMDDMAKTHKPLNKCILKMVEKLLSFELSMLKSKKRIPFGGSILIAAIKD